MSVKIKQMPVSEFWVIVDVKQSKPIGFFGVAKNNEVYGFYVDPDYRNNGVATEAISQLRKHKGKLRIWAYRENTPMLKVLEKLGFEKFLLFEG